MTTKERLHQLVDRLPESELATAEHVLAALARPDDRLAELLANAPDDDEPVTDEDIKAIERGLEDYHSGRTMSADDFLRGQRQ